MVAFMVQREVEGEKDVWRPVLRDECAHAFAHKDQYNLPGEQDQEELSLRV